MRRSRLLAVGVLIAVTGVVLATACVGPIVRGVIGVPFGYGSDYASPQVLLEALAAITLTMTIICTAWGWLSVWTGKALAFRDAAWMFNPLTITAAFFILMRAMDSSSIAMEQLAGEYVGSGVLGIQALLGSPIYAGAVRLGVLLHPAHRSSRPSQ